MNKLRRLPFGAKQAALLLLAIIIVNFGLVKVGSITISKTMQQELVMLTDRAHQETPRLTSQSPYTMSLDDIDELSLAVIEVKLDMIKNSPAGTELGEDEVTEIEQKFYESHNSLKQVLKHKYDINQNILNTAMWFALIWGMCYLGSMFNFSWFAKQPVMVFCVVISIRLLVTL
ncbi:hypothetical protein [Vibrio crassostreae]|uniref:hypothetical protein n=1 Tax=Vibrio crassostreae TaxID=246167 RepID=UPI001B30B5C5|nr:hypothetical protein [Vibrio crassostreae]